jgi:hypothetical protein
VRCGRRSPAHNDRPRQEAPAQDLVARVHAGHDADRPSHAIALAEAVERAAASNTSAKTIDLADDDTAIAFAKLSIRLHLQLELVAA